MKKLVLFSIDSSDAKIKAALEEMATTLDSGIEDVFVVNNNKEDIKNLLSTKFGVHDKPTGISTKDLIAISNIVRKTIIEISAEIETNRDTFKYNGVIFKKSVVNGILIKISTPKEDIIFSFSNWLVITSGEF